MPTFAFPYEFHQMQFAMMDVNRRAQGDALELCGFGPIESDYRVISTGPHWRLREYADAHANRRPSVLIVPAPIKRPYIWDLAPSVSAVRHCLDHRFRVYLLEWTPASDDVQPIGVGEYAKDAISECVARVSRRNAGTGAVLGWAFARRHTGGYFLRDRAKRPWSCVAGSAALFRAGVEPVSG